MQNEKASENKGNSFSWALEQMRVYGLTVQRTGWNNESIKVRIQNPDENSFMTEPYLYMEKGSKRFPLDLSAESTMANDWVVKEE